MSKLTKRGAIAEIQMQGEKVPAVKNIENEERKEIEELNRLVKEPMSTTVLPSTKVLMTRLQEDAQSKGWRKPKVGELIDEAIKKLAESRNIT